MRVVVAVFRCLMDLLSILSPKGLGRRREAKHIWEWPSFTFVRNTRSSLLTSDTVCKIPRNLRVKRL